MVPTLTGVMGIDFNPVRELHGLDLTERILGVDREEDRMVYTHVNHGVEVTPLPGAVRNVRWRLVANANGTLELTSRNDAQERLNLADSLPELADSLYQQYAQWFEPLKTRRIPPIPVGVIDSVVIPAHEGLLTGKASYFWSSNGWANDWVHCLDMETSSISWPLNIVHPGTYQCYLNYASKGKNSILSLQLGSLRIEKELSAFIPVSDQSYSRIDRPAEAIGQTWKREYMGDMNLVNGPESLVIQANDADLELLSVVLIRK
jgi:hypothetical protein